MPKIWCFGSINVDLFYDVPHIPAPGETLSATGHSVGLGGKGANQSTAIAKAGGDIEHIGAVGQSSEWVLERLEAAGVGTTHVAVTDVPTGQAIINVADDGENAIVLLKGANYAHSKADVLDAIQSADAGDFLVMQNETGLQAEAAVAARASELRIFYSAAPFETDAVKAVLQHIDTLLLNEIEASQLEESLGKSLFALEVPNIIVTLGAKGARWVMTNTGDTFEVDALKVDAVDTTGAGDTFAGYVIASLARGLSPQEAMGLASKAAALKVTRRGAADAIPTLAEVEAFQP